MQSILSNLKLFHKISLGFYFFLFVIVVLVLTFYSISVKTTKEIENNYAHEMMIRKANNNLTTSLKRLDFLAIKNSLESVPNYKKKIDKIYKDIVSNLNLLKRDSFFVKNDNVNQILRKILQRVDGYKMISASLKEDMRVDYEDGVYSILALTTTSSIISKEMNQLAKEIEIESTKNKQILESRIRGIYMFVFLTLAVFFVFMIILNRYVVSSISRDLDKLEEMISSFFEYLSKKRDKVKHIHFENNDEIATIANIIDSNLYIAEDILEKERKEASYIQDKIEEATSEIRELSNEIESTQREVVFTMGAIAEERSKETGKHVQRVAEYSLILARLYGLPLEEAMLLKDASPMHDIGKIGIPDAVLNKPGRFTNEEFEIMKGHAEIGYSMLKHSKRSILKAAAIVAHEHHERWDGKGYPRGLKGEEIHIYGRITAIADVFDALGSERVYKDAWPIKKILQLFEDESAKQFDPELVEIFMDNLPHFLAARENIDSYGTNGALSKYIEDFDKQAKII